MRETILPFTYTVKEILDYPSDVYFSNTGDMVGMFECMFDEFGIFCDIDYSADISRIKVNVKYDIEYDCSRGAILSVLYLDDRNIKIEFTNNISKDADIETIWYVEEDFIENYFEDYTYKTAKKEFEPFTLNIEVNTLDEAKSLWNRFNLNYRILCEATHSDYYNVEFENRLKTHKYWNQIDNILKDLGEEPDIEE